MELQKVVNLINSHPERAKNALDHVYHGKVFVVVTANGHIDSYFKTRRGAEGYIKRQTRISWYDDYTQSMVNAGAGLEIVEIKADQIKDHKTDKQMWWNWFFDWLDRPHWADNIVQAAKCYDVSVELLSWIEETAKEVKETHGLKALDDEQETVERNGYHQEEQESEQGSKENMSAKKTLIFEGAGWEGAESSIISGVGNCRIRTRIRNNEGRVIYLKMSGFIHSEKNKPKFAEGFTVIGHVDYCYYADSKWDSRRSYSEGLRDIRKTHYEYSKESILKLVNEKLNCSFNDMIVINDGSVRVFDTNEPLSDCSDGDFEPYKDIEVNINVLANVAPLEIWDKVRFAKFKISYEFVKQLDSLNRWIRERHPTEQERFPKLTYFAGVRWDENGIITGVEISTLQGQFCTMSISSESLISVINEILRFDNIKKGKRHLITV